jgi:hypothetical protein
MHRIPRILQFVSILLLAVMLGACGMIAAQIGDVQLADPFGLDGQEFRLSNVASWYEPESVTAGGLRAAADPLAPLLAGSIFTGEGVGGLNDQMTRAQFARVAGLLLGLDSASQPAAAFTDLPASQWAYGWVSANLSRYGGDFSQHERDYQEIALRAWNDAFEAARADDVPFWFKPLVFAVQPQEIDLGGQNWVINQIKRYSQPVSIKSFTVATTSESVTAPESLMLQGLSLRVMASTLSVSGQLTELATLELDRAFQEPVEYLAGSGGRYRAAQGVNIDAGELKLPSAAAVRLINAFKRQETIIMTVDLAVVLEAASLDGLELAFELGAGDATISFRK